ncbi:hypothetical protein FOZ62_022227 [Perkinsus olseni]|uniref:Uncharacterized protein n=1 Tax=Perkinsus olseni TaxID=32597 RepID=A0A7J6R6E1_PEROL|nr:hypothetical protein FOZ62_022227 [Perkinsus olseni]
MINHIRLPSPVTTKPEAKKDANMINHTEGDENPESISEVVRTPVADTTPMLIRHIADNGKGSRTAPMIVHMNRTKSCHTSEAKPEGANHQRASASITMARTTGMLAPGHTVACQWCNRAKKVLELLAPFIKATGGARSAL